MNAVTKLIAKLNNQTRRQSQTKPTVAGRDMTVFQDDTFLVSYPRSGNTWMRFLIAQAKTGQPQTFQTLEQVIPDPWIFPDAALLQFPRPRIIKSHEAYDPHYAKVIYLVRDPRDVAISFYYWRKKKNFFSRKEINLSLRAYLYQFAEHEIAFITDWGTHTRSWKENCVNLGDNFLCIRYEDMIENVYDVLKKVCTFMDWDISEETLVFAIRNSTPDRLRTVENPPEVEGSIPFVRKAQTKQWKEVFDQHLNGVYVERYREWLEIFAYDLDL